MNTALRVLVVMVFAAGVVLIGAEELRRKARRIKVTEAAKHQMMHMLHPDTDFRKPKLSDKVKADAQESEQRAQLKSEMRPEEKEKLDPTGVRSLINKLLK